MCVSTCQRLWESHSSGHEGPHCSGAWWVGPSPVCFGTCWGMDHSYPVAPSISQTLSVCVVNGVTCLFGSDPPLFFYLLCFSASLWTSSLLLLPIAYLPSILLYDNKSMWVSNDFSQIQQDNCILPHSLLITWKSDYTHEHSGGTSGCLLSPTPHQTHRTELSHCPTHSVAKNWCSAAHLLWVVISIYVVTVGMASGTLYIYPMTLQDCCFFEKSK